MGGLAINHGFCASIVRCAWLASGRPFFRLALTMGFCAGKAINTAAVATVEAEIPGSEEMASAGFDFLSAGDTVIGWSELQIGPQCLSPHVLHLGASMRLIDTI